MFYHLLSQCDRIWHSTDDREKKKALELLAERYYPGGKAASDREIADEFDRVCMLELSIEHISGKQARELIPTTELEH